MDFTKLLEVILNFVFWILEKEGLNLDVKTDAE